MNKSEHSILFDFFGKDFKTFDIEVCKRAAFEGDGKAQAFMAFCYLLGYFDSDNDEDMAYGLAKEAAKVKCPEGFVVLGLCYQYGIGVEQDEKKALNNFKKAYDYGNNNPIALCYFGEVYLEGKIVRQNLEKGLELLKLAVENKSTRAINLLSDYYLDEDDLRTAISFLKKGAKLKDWHCQTALGIGYLNGMGGLKQDEEKAFEIIKRVADETNYGDALHWLSMFYEEGIVVKKDKKLAKIYSQKAIENGYEESSDDSPKTLEDYYNEEVSVMENAQGAVNYLTDKKHVLNYVVFIESDDGFGSGFILDSQGYVATCAHVVRNAKKLLVKINEADGNKKVCKASVVKINNKTDVAIIKLENASNLCFAEIDSERIEPDLGEEITLYGYPLADKLNDNLLELNASVTKGIIASNQKKKGIRRSMLDILACHGNSGGPVISCENGKVIGLLSGSEFGTPGKDLDEVNYMIPVCYLRELIEENEDEDSDEVLSPKTKSSNKQPEKKEVEEIEASPEETNNEAEASEKKANLKAFKNWAEVKRFLRSNYKVDDEENDILAFLFDLENGRTQRVFVELNKAQVNATEWISISSCIGLIDETEINEVLLELGKLCFGGLIREENKHYLRYTVLLKSASEQSLLDPIEAIASIADELEEKYVGGDQY